MTSRTCKLFHPGSCENWWDLIMKTKCIIIIKKKKTYNL